jgi:S-adenosylmethionine decarboxylase proenzyme
LNNPNRLSFETNRPQSRKLVETRSIAARGPYFTPTIDHWVLQFHGVEPDRINNPERLQTLLNEVVDRLELTRVSEHSHYFHPGVSTVIILSESHLSAHTWPEYGYMHVDIVTCVKKLTPGGLEEAFQEAFGPAHCHMVQMDYMEGK